MAPALPKPKPWTAVKLQLLLPGETAAPNTPSGKTGTPTPQTAGVPFTVTVNAVNSSWNIDSRDHASDVVHLAASGGSPSLPADAALVGGTKTFQVTFPSAGGPFTLTASDVTDGSITANTSPGLTVNAAVGGFTKLQILLPGESAAPGTPSGKTGTPTVRAIGVAFPVVVNAVDANWNVVSSTHTVGITASGGSPTLPANAALVGGTKTFQVTFGAAGSFTLTATDLTDGSKTANTSPSVTVNPVTIATTPVLDNFNRSNQALSGGGWAAYGSGGPTYPPNMLVVSNQLGAGSGGGNIYYSGSTFGPDCEVYATVPVYSTAGGGDIYLRLSNPGPSFNVYTLSFQFASGCVIARAIGGAWTSLTPFFGGVPQAGDTYLFRAVGTNPTTLEAWRLRGGSWVKLASVTDSTAVLQAAGYLGTDLWDDIGRFDDFGGGTIQGSSSSTFTKLQIVLPQGATQTSGVAFNVTVNAVDANGNLVNTVSDSVSLTGAGSPSIPASPGALVAGTKTFAVTYPAAGSFSLTATDITDPTKTSATTTITVNAPTRSWPASFFTGPLGSNNILPTTASGVFLGSMFGGDGYSMSYMRSQVASRQAAMGGGRKYDVLQWHYDGGGTYGGTFGCEDPTDAGGSNRVEQFSLDNGSHPMIVWTPNLNIGQMLAGAADAIWTKMGAYWATYKPNRIMLRAFHEFDLGFAWGIDGAGGPYSPAQFKAAWQRMVNTIRAAGGTNVGFMWNPTEGAIDRSRLATYYPGDTWVDWVGTDWYNVGRCSQSTYLHTGWAEWAELFNYGAFSPYILWSQYDIYGSGVAVSGQRGLTLPAGLPTRKPFFIGETACIYDTQNPTLKSTWYPRVVSALNGIKSMPNCIGVSFYDCDVHRGVYCEPGCDYNYFVDHAGVQGSADAGLLANWVTMAQDPKFRGK